jgi:hypothetical protein
MSFKLTKMEYKSLDETISELVNNFARHSYLVQENGTLKSNLFDLLQDFWCMKLNEPSDNGGFCAPTQNSHIAYEYLERPGAPYVCFVTLPGGACFATFQVIFIVTSVFIHFGVAIGIYSSIFLSLKKNSNTKLEAKKSAALISFMNSILNEHPLRRITHQFISESLETAMRDNVRENNFVLKFKHLGLTFKEPLFF